MWRVKFIAHEKSLLLTKEMISFDEQGTSRAGDLS